MPDAAPLDGGDPRRIGRYRLTSRFAASTGDGEAFLASAPDGTRVVVILLDRDRVADPAARDRFTAEARAACQIVPLCAAGILDAGLESGQPYLVREFVPGPSLAEVVAREGPLPPDIVAALAIGTATGLTVIHQAGLVHGDFGPDHVMFGPEGPRVTHTGITPPYGTATPAADLFAWAKTLLLAATGRPPIGPQDLAALPAEVAAAAAPCLDPLPTGRPAAHAVLAALLGDGDFPDGLLAEGCNRARAAARALPDAVAGPPGGARARGRTIAWVAGSAVIVAALGAVGVYLESPAGHTSASPAAAPGSPRPGGSSPAPTIPAALAGTWSGQVHQTSPVLTVTVRIALPPGSAAGTVAYPALGCSGKLAVASLSGNSISVRQTIAVGSRKCDNGTITLALRQPGTLEFTFRRPGGDNPMGTLTRGG